MRRILALSSPRRGRGQFRVTLSSHRLTSASRQLYQVTMPYDQTIQFEAQYADNLGPCATEDKFHATYNGILAHWFPTSRGYIIDHQVDGTGGKPE